MKYYPLIYKNQREQTVDFDETVQICNEESRQVSGERATNRSQERSSKELFTGLGSLSQNEFRRAFSKLP